MTPSASKPSIGGQAVMEGVMMRGPISWAVACRLPNEEIEVEAFSVPSFIQRHPWLKWPFLRGVYVLGESLAIGVKALMISANHQLAEEEEKPSDKTLGWTLAVATIFFSALFIVSPAIISKVSSHWLGIHSTLWQNIFEGAVRIGFFLAYIIGISFVPDMRRVFQYHGAEHKTIYAYENDDPLQPEIVDRYTTLHVRCGTNFLFIVMFLTILVHFFLDLALKPFPVPLKIAARVLIIPLLAGSAYEVIKAASRNDDSLLFKIISLPGLALQKITTRPPTREQIEVAIKAMEAVIARESLGQIEKSVETGDLDSIDPEPGTAPAAPS